MFFSLFYQPRTLRSMWHPFNSSLPPDDCRVLVPRDRVGKHNESTLNLYRHVWRRQNLSICVMVWQRRRYFRIDGKMSLALSRLNGIYANVVQELIGHFRHCHHVLAQGPTRPFARMKMRTRKAVFIPAPEWTCPRTQHRSSLRQNAHAHTQEAIYELSSIRSRLRIIYSLVQIQNART